MLPSLRVLSICLAAFAVLSRAQSSGDNAAVGKLLERITLQEPTAVQKLRTRSAVLETYIQELGDNADAAEPGIHDHYFLGRLDFAKGLNYVPLVTRSESAKVPRLALGLLKGRAPVFLPGGFAQMVVPDGENFNARNYRFDYIRREFLGEVRCLVFAVSPLHHKTITNLIS